MKCIYLFLGLLICHSCNQSTSNYQQLSEVIKPVVLHVNGLELFQYWEIDKDDNNFKLSEQQGLKVYKDALVQILGKEQLNKILRMESSIDGPLRKQRVELEQGEIDNYKLSHNGTTGVIRPINNLEYQLLNYQVSRFPLLSHPTEFHAFILANDKLNKQRLCLAGGDKPWPPRPNPIFDYMKKVLGDDWYLSTHLHNHFEPDTAGYVGLLAPSMSDAQYFKMLRDDFDIPNTLITNGFHTVMFDSDRFDEFNVHEQ